jgi:hypothetical protein
VCAVPAQEGQVVNLLDGDCIDIGADVQIAPGVHLTPRRIVRAR